jgi:TRAP-type uncharacterized transport system fused permease subunit
MKGSILDIAIVLVTSLFGIWLICAAMTGYLRTIMTFQKRIVFALTGIAMLLPHQASDFLLWVNVAGVLAGIALVLYEMKRKEMPHVRA